MTILTSDNFKSEIGAHEGLAVIDLYADWCGPCKMLAPILAELEEEYPEVKFCKANVDEQPGLASLFHVESIPFVAFVKGDTVCDVSVGYVPKQKLAEIIDGLK